MKTIAPVHAGLSRLDVWSLERFFDWFTLNKSLREAKVQTQIRLQSADMDLVWWHWVNTRSDRYELFATKGVKCVSCGIEGSFFALERSTKCNHDRHQKNRQQRRPHFNLYAVREDGQEVLMTKDHILPKSKGGKDRLENYQTMCKVCNETKADSLQYPALDLSSGAGGGSRTSSSTGPQHPTAGSDLQS